MLIVPYFRLNLVHPSLGIILCSRNFQNVLKSFDVSSAVFQNALLFLAAFSGAASARVAMEADATFERPTWSKGARVSAKDTIDVTFVLKTCPMKRAKLEAKVFTWRRLRFMFCSLLHAFFLSLFFFGILCCLCTFGVRGVFGLNIPPLPCHALSIIGIIITVFFCVCSFALLFFSFLLVYFNCSRIVLGRLRPLRPRVQEVPFPRRHWKLAAPPSQ